MRLAKVTTTSLVKTHVRIGAGATECGAGSTGVAPGAQHEAGQSHNDEAREKKNNQSCALWRRLNRVWRRPAQHSIERALVTTTVPAKKKILAGCQVLPIILLHR